MNQTILRIGFFLVGNHQYFIQNYTQILSFADQNFGSTETPVFWKDREMKQAYLISVYDNINYRPCFIHVSRWLFKHIHHNRWFIYFFWQKIRIQRFWCMLVYEMQFLSEHFPNVFFFWSTTMHCVFLPKVVIIVNIPEILKKFEICFSVNG